MHKINETTEIKEYLFRRMIDGVIESGAGPNTVLAYLIVNVTLHIFYIGRET